MLRRGLKSLFSSSQNVGTTLSSLNHSVVCTPIVSRLMPSTTQYFGVKIRRFSSSQSRNVVLVGRPNVGKSTLFNRLVGGRTAIVSRIPGTTRDSRQAEANLAGLEFVAIDTGGLEEGAKGSMEEAITNMTARAVGHAGVVIFMIDAKDGVTDADVSFARWLRRRIPNPKTQIHVVANKTEGIITSPDTTTWDQISADATRLGFGLPIPLSAEHGDGLVDLYHVISQRFDMNENHEDTDETKRRRQMKIAILGQPNVGKSTLVNAMMGENVVMTGPTPGLTRDAVKVDMKGSNIAIYDTAGIRRASKRDHTIPHETLAATRAIRTMENAHITVLLIDGQSGSIPKQDLSLISAIIEEGRGLVVAVTKCDQIPCRETALEGVSQTLQNHLSYSQVGEIPVVAVSSITGEGISDVMPAVERAHECWERRVSTHRLNQWIRRYVALMPMPSGFRVKYATQVSSRPPTFSLFCNRDVLPETHIRSLKNALRDEFDIHGVTVRIQIRKRSSDVSIRKSEKREQKSRSSKVRLKPGRGDTAMSRRRVVVSKRRSNNKKKRIGG
jgi:GTPase